MSIIQWVEMKFFLFILIEMVYNTTEGGGGRVTAVILVLCTCSLLGPNDDFIVQQIRHVCS